MATIRDSDDSSNRAATRFSVDTRLRTSQIRHTRAQKTHVGNLLRALHLSLFVGQHQPAPGLGGRQPRFPDGPPMRGLKPKSGTETCCEDGNDGSVDGEGTDGVYEGVRCVAGSDAHRRTDGL